MNVALRTPTMTREQFLLWAERQEEPYEFDGTRPVPMNGGEINHFAIAANIVAALHGRLRGSTFLVLSAGMMIATETNSARAPDALVCPKPADGTVRLAPDPIAVFEVVSPTSERTDRILKAREYLGVPSIRRYIIVERTTRAVTVLERGETSWTARPLVGGEEIEMPELGISVPISDFYEGVDLPDES